MSCRRWMAMLVLVMAAATPALAQRNDGGGPPDFAEMRQRMLDRMKEMLGASDDEWKVLLPKIEKVQQLQRDASTRGGMFMFLGPGGSGGPGGPPGGSGGPGGPGGGPGGDQPQSPVMQKTQDLRTALENKDTSPDQLKAKLQALRDARAKAREDLTKAQGELRDVLTTRQESVLVMLGMLE